MLKILTESDLNSLLTFCEGKILGARIACYALSYGFDKDFLTFWGDKNDNKFSKIVTEFYGSVTVLNNDVTDLEELRNFLGMIGAESITTDCTTAGLLNFSQFETKTGYKYLKSNNSVAYAEDAAEADLKGIYTLISEAIPNSFENTKEAYLAFLSDFTYRKRRGYAAAKCIHHDGKVVSSVITAAQSHCDALLSGVACDEKFRKYGYGKRTVLSLADELHNKGKNVFVIALNKSAEGFYEHIGFIECEKIAFINRKVL